MLQNVLSTFELIIECIQKAVKKLAIKLMNAKTL